MERMEQHRANALAALRALPPEQVVSVLVATLPTRSDLSANEWYRLLEIIGPLHQDAWAKEIKEKYDSTAKIREN